MLTERDGELHLLRRVVDDLPTTGGKVALVRGEAGIGKSALVAELGRLCASATRVLNGACDDLFIPMPFAPFWDVARDEERLRPALEQRDRTRFMQTLMDVLSDARPTLLVIEDLHWADEATLDAIRYVGRRVQRINAAIVLTYRPGEMDLEHPLRAVIGDIPASDVVHMQLGGLSLGAVTTLVAGSGLDPAVVFEMTGGNPLLAGEMAASAIGSTPTSLHDAVLGRLRRLSIGAQEAIKTLAVIPEPVPRADVVRIAGIDDERLDEALRRELLAERNGRVDFRHELLRRIIESSLTEGERLAKHRAVLAGLPEDTHPCLIIHCAMEAHDVDRLIKVSPRSARYAAAVGGHQQAVEDFRTLGPHLERFDDPDRAALLDEWAEQEYFVERVEEAIRLNALAQELYRGIGDRGAESRVLTRAARFHEFAGHRQDAVVASRRAVDVLGHDGDGRDLAQALEVGAYLEVMAGDVSGVKALVERTLTAAGPDVDDEIGIRSRIHLGAASNLSAYPTGSTTLEDAHSRAEDAGAWFESARALLMLAWTAIEARDLRAGADAATRAVAYSVRHDLPSIAGSAGAQQARVLELTGSWDQAADIARELASRAAIIGMVALPILGVLESRRGRPSASAILEDAWVMATEAGEFQRLVASATANTEHAWINGLSVVDPEQAVDVMEAGLERGMAWPAGLLGFWLWKCGCIPEIPGGVAEPYRLVARGKAAAAAAILGSLGMPYEQAQMLSHGDRGERLQGLELMETLGATAVASRARRLLREDGIIAPRGRGRDTRRNTAGLTARQAEVLGLLDEGLSNLEIADRLFVSPRTVENHVAAILDKLDSDTRESAVARARGEGLLVRSA